MFRYVVYILTWMTDCLNYCNSYMDQGIQEWTKQNLWKTAFKKFYLVHS